MWINLATGKVYWLPEGHEVACRSLEDIQVSDSDAVSDCGGATGHGTVRRPLDAGRRQSED